MQRILPVLIVAALLAPAAWAQSGEKIVIDGSTGVMPLAAALARAFQSRHPGMSVELGKGMGTKARFQALAEGKIDIALASHGLNVADISRQGMKPDEVARMAVVFGVNGGVPIASLTEQQICDIYAAKTANWKALGGAEMDIAPRTRPDSEVDAEVVRAGIKCLADLRMPASVKVMASAGDMAKELAATGGAIGMTTMTAVEQSRGGIRAVSLNGVAPSAANVEQRTYPLVRESFFVTRAQPPAAVTRFMEFVRSAEGSKVIRENGAIPLR